MALTAKLQPGIARKPWKIGNFCLNPPVALSQMTELCSRSKQNEEPPALEILRLVSAMNSRIASVATFLVRKSHFM